MMQEFDEGSAAFRANEWLDANPYMKPSDEWKAWREGWAQAEWEIWDAVQKDKRKASTV